MSSIKVLDPTANRQSDNASPGPDAGPLAGKKIGIRVDQIWRCWDWISENWEAKFRAAGAEVSYWRSTNRSGEEGEEQLRSLVEWLDTLDCAIFGLANCGSCTGWTVHDAIASANAGLPTTVVATQNFEEFAHELSERGGRSGMRVHVLPYPLNELSRAEVDPVAEEYFDGLIKVMGASIGEQKAAA
ncbi:UGSC family (seleno)protein [Pontixanthobacter aquaemixtae]|uniref:UGSC-like domain-containing protein n=1 Tax=Pontixanthobacter aquaemixtae TaxID=1958940 RepID=A0A844ZNF1_9SPHN|nr:hypothetical protein [Pontixanthobacter aquaemixtae]MXO89901.1 hypothetical protein [Pontixanthobacter aquaemixtae]